MPTPVLSRESELALHLRLCAFEADAPADACRLYLDLLLNYLAAKHPRVDPHTRQEAVDTALFAYLRKPSLYDPERGSLAGFLCLAAHGDLLNLLRTEGRHQRGRKSLSAVELDEDAGNLSGREPEPATQLQRDEEAEQARAFVQGFRDGCTPEEGRVFELMLAGERANATYAEALGIAGLPIDEQAKEVKRVKDRLKKRLERGGVEHG
jgi:DNA-directed RNA polymerase specialized sigma24 family protein